MHFHILGSAELRELNGFSYRSGTSFIYSFSNDSDDVLMYAPSNAFISNPTSISKFLSTELPPAGSKENKMIVDYCQHSNQQKSCKLQQD